MLAIRLRYFTADGHVTETWLSAKGDEAKTVELAPSGFDVKSFPHQS